MKGFRELSSGYKSLNKEFRCTQVWGNFRQLKERNPSFYFAYEFDEENRMKHVLLVNGISRKTMHYLEILFLLIPHLELINTH